MRINNYKQCLVLLVMWTISASFRLKRAIATTAEMQKNANKEVWEAHGKLAEEWRTMMESFEHVERITGMTTLKTSGNVEILPEFFHRLFNILSKNLIS